MNSLGRCERTGNTLYVDLVLIQQDLVSFNATGAKRYLANGVAADIEDDPSSHQLQSVVRTYSKDMEPRPSVSGAPSVDGPEIRAELAFGMVGHFRRQTRWREGIGSWPLLFQRHLFAD